MGLLFRSLPVLWLLVWSPWLYCFGEQSSLGDARALDALLQDYAFRGFVNPKTGVVFDGTVPSNLTGIKVAGLRLKNGSLRKRGFHNPSYKEFEIPMGVDVQPYVERLVLVYQNLGNWSSVYYPLSGYTYLSPVLGLLSYDAWNLSATNLPELDVTASGAPIKIHFSNVKSAPDRSSTKCAWFTLLGEVNFSTVKSDNTCLATQLGHFALVAEGHPPSPAVEAPGPSSVSHKKKKSMKKVWIVVGSVVGGLLVLVLLGMLLAWSRKYRQGKEMENMEKASEVGEALRMTPIGSGKAPAAMVTRTQPTLESEYAP